MKTLARIVHEHVSCPSCGWPMLTRKHGDHPVVVCVTQGCKQVGIEFVAPVTEFDLKLSTTANPPHTQ